MQQNSKSSMFWTNEKRKLSDLKPWQRNPRQIKDKQAKLLAESFSDFGQVETIAISANGDIYNGHQRLSVLAGKYGMDYEVDVRVSSRDLTEKERERLTVYLHRGATGEWDFDELANWDMSDLLTWGFEESDFPFDVAPAMEDTRGDDDDTYTKKIEAPVYKPTGERPATSELFDDSRTVELIAEIESSNSLSNEDKKFLSIAARRHTIFRYDKIAEYYAHANENLQKHMEDSALVIVDFNRAIELGYVKLSEEIAKLYGEDYPDAE